MSNKHLNGYIKENDDDIYHATHYPTCRFCGKQTIPTARYESDADADEAATMACDCYDARQYREQKAQAERREKNIAKLKSSINAVQDYCTEHNIKVGDEFCTLVTNAGVAVIDGIVGAAAFKFSRLSIKLASGNKSAVVIKVTYSDGTQYEV